MSPNLQDRFVFLSASYPTRDFAKLADSQEIASAVRALVATVFHANGKILFGGHPSISPLVLMMAREFGQRGRILIYQSKVFDGSLSEATLRLQEEGYGEIVSTRIDKAEMQFLTPTPNPAQFPNSLTIMREEMLSRDTTNPAAAVLIGGDTGLFQERNLFEGRLPGAPLYAVGVPGGAAQKIAESILEEGPSALRSELLRSRNYLSLMRDLVADIEDHIGGDGKISR